MSDDTEPLDEPILAEDLTPHAKQNMTSPFGRLVERITYVDVLLLAGLVLLASSLWFRFGPNGQALKEGGASLLDCVYFVLVTFTSLGYGELLPVGFGRIVAILDVLSGLLLTAIFIGKVASERQSSLLLLLHTSDTQRRISDFADELQSMRTRIQGFANDGSVADLNLALEAHLRLTKAMGNYLMFNAHQASVVEFGNFTALIGLYDEIRDSFKMLQKLHGGCLQLADVMVMRRSFSNMSKLTRIVHRMGALHHKPRSRDSLWRAAIRVLLSEPPAAPPNVELSARNRLTALERYMDAKIVDARAWTAIGHHPIQIERVFEAFPAKPRSEWPTGIHKVIAGRLNISNSVATLCITDLLNAKRLPKRGGKACVPVGTARSLRAVSDQSAS